MKTSPRRGQKAVGSLDGGRVPARDARRPTHAALLSAICLAVLVLFTAAAPGVHARTPTRPTRSDSVKEFGVWFWQSPYVMTWRYSQRLLDQAKANGFNAIYITVDDYLAIAAEPDSPQKVLQLQAYNAAVEKFITYANQGGIAVDAEGGSPDWVEAANRSKPYGILTFASQFNATHAVKFRNVQFDVEPYTLPTYKTDEVAILTEYIDMVNQLVSQNMSGGGIEMVIPFFYGKTPNITYNGQTGSAFTLLLSTLDQKAGNAMLMMAYRNYASGRGGTLDISNAGMDQASQPGHSTTLIIAQETSNVHPSYVTFYGTSRADLFSQIAIINSAYASSSAFNGIAIEYIKPFGLLH
ncbi:MAG: hypothetical protein ABI306_03325 [Caulobacteraceae bacterium]